MCNQAGRKNTFQIIFIVFANGIGNVTVCCVAYSRVKESKQCGNIYYSTVYAMVRCSQSV